MNAILAAAIIFVVFAVGDMVSAKTKAIVSMLLVASVVFLAGFWTGVFPTTMFADSTLLSMAGLLVTMLLVHLGTTIKLRDFGAQWRTVIISAVACVAISAAVFFLGQLIVDRGFALVGAPILSGGVVATLTMQDMANKANLPDWRYSPRWSCAPRASWATLWHPCASRARPSASRRRSTPVSCRWTPPPAPYRPPPRAARS